MRSTQVNVRRLRALARHVQKHPKIYSQASFCGSAYCLASHALMKWGTPDQRKAVRWFGVRRREQDAARELLGLPANSLDPSYATRLFEARWPRRYTTRTGRVTPRLAAKRIEDLIAGVPEAQ